jgi:8-oxo-dGTP pyrophosphatase MutT (NUDIX family)
MNIEGIKNRLNGGIIGRKKYFNSAVLASLIKIEGEYHFIFEKRSKNIRQGGEISFPGGGYDEEDKDFEATAIREVVEELGAEEDKIEIWGKLGTLTIPAGILVEIYVGELHCKVEELKINKDEVEDILLIPINHFEDKPPKHEKLTIQMCPYYELDGNVVEIPSKYYNLPEKYHKPWKGRERDIYFYEYNGEVIWGITADIIYEIINKIKKK